MADLLLKDAADKAGISYAAMRKDAERGKIKVKRDGNRTVTTDEDLAAYMASKGLAKLADTLGDTKAVTAGVRELGNIWANLDPKLQAAILDGIPKTSNGKVSGGNAEAWKRATKGRREVSVTEESPDPHFGHPVGYRHRQTPRWGRISESTWELDGATYSWNGLVWEGGGKAEGRVLSDDNVSPAAPASDRRPLAPSKAVAR